MDTEIEKIELDEQANKLDHNQHARLDANELENIYHIKRAVTSADIDRIESVTIKLNAAGHEAGWQENGKYITKPIKEIQVYIKSSEKHIYASEIPDKLDLTWIRQNESGGFTLELQEKTSKTLTEYLIYIHPIAKGGR